MKKSLLSLFGLVLAFSALFVSCKDEPDNNKEENSGIPCEINIIASDGGDVQFSDYFGNSKHVYTGSKVTIIATADEDYAFIGWYVVGNNENLVSNTASYTFTTQGDLQLLAKFAKYQDITVGSSNGGSVSFKDSEEKDVRLLPGEEVTVVATPDEYYMFDGWYNGETQLSTELEYSFEVSSSLSLVARFCEYPSVTVGSSVGGIASIAGSTEASVKILPGKEVAVVAIPDEYYTFDGWYNGETQLSTELEYSFEVSSSLSLVARFCEYPSVTVSSSVGGIASIAGSTEASVKILPGEEVTVIATVDEGYEFVGWFIGNSEETVSTDLEYTFTVTTAVTLVAKFGTVIDGHAYVDLGLPSGLKWATCNVGANSPEEYGGYYAWGETEEKSNYDWSTYKWCNGSENTMTKYCADSDYGIVDNKTVLDPEDDVAHVKWGGSWRMPTIKEQDELRNKCSWTWTTQNGVNGYRVTGPNGNSIFLPAAGSRYGTVVNYRGSYGYYPSSSLNSLNSDNAYDLVFNVGDYNWFSYDYRYFGHSVRPVAE